MGTHVGTPGRRPSIVASIFFAALGGSIACSAADPGGSLEPRVGCEPGTVAECYCSNGSTGTQACSEDGTFDACEGCDAAGAVQPSDNGVPSTGIEQPNEPSDPMTMDPVLEDPVEPLPEDPPPTGTTEPLPVEPPPPEPPPPPPTDPDVPSTEHCAPVAGWDPLWAQWEAEVLLLINERRAVGANCGYEGSFGPAPPLTTNATLRCSARLHSLDMGVRDFFEHTNPDNLDPFQRMQAAGYFGSMMAENIAAGAASPAQVVDGWMNSPGHCLNIMHPAFTEIGVGYYFDAAESPFSGGAQHYWTQNFGAPL